LVISNTFLGARSTGRRIVRIPASASSSTKTSPTIAEFSSPCSDFSPLSSELDPEVILENEVFVGCVTELPDIDDISVATNMARTCGGNEVQASIMEDGTIGDKLTDSSLLHMYDKGRLE
jgi:hypothetical protein